MIQLYDVAQVYKTDIVAQPEGSNLVAVKGKKPLLTKGSARWSSRFCRGLLPVTMACTAMPETSANLADLHRMGPQ